TTINQSAKINLANKVIVDLFENTEITMKERDKHLEVINLNTGEIHVDTQPHKGLKTKSIIKVETPAGEIINRGTKFSVSVTNNEQRKEQDMKGITKALTVLVTVMVMEGQVSFTNSYGEQVVNAGETAIASADAKPVLLTTKIKELIQQLGADDWRIHDVAEEELIQLGKKLIERYRIAKKDKQQMPYNKLKKEIEKFANDLNEGCKSQDPEIRTWSNQIRQHFYDDLLSQTKITFLSNDAIYVINADGKNLKRLTEKGSYGPVWSPDGTKIAFLTHRAGDGIYVMDADGKNQQQLTQKGGSHPAWSPDGTKIVFNSFLREGNTEIYVMDADGKNQTRLTDNKAIDQLPAWSPDGTKIVFTSNRDDGYWEIYIMDADGKNQIRLTDNKAEDNPANAAVWSPDGKKIAFVSHPEIYVIDIVSKNQIRLTDNKAKDNSPKTPSWSPDSKKIAFESERRGDWAIYVIDADGKNQTRLTTRELQSRFPVWSPDGKKIAFVANGIYIMDAAGRNQTRLTAGYIPTWGPLCLAEVSVLFAENQEEALFERFIKYALASKEEAMKFVSKDVTYKGKPAYDGLKRIILKLSDDHRVLLRHTILSFKEANKVEEGFLKAFGLPEQQEGVETARKHVTEAMKKGEYLGIFDLGEDHQNRDRDVFFFILTNIEGRYLITKFDTD
ncbi:DPP IV N-terminal domain-containing protein, partial [Planctomycetota bacterium]